VQRDDGHDFLDLFAEGVHFRRCCRLRGSGLFLLFIVGRCGFARQSLFDSNFESITWLNRLYQPEGVREAFQKSIEKGV